LDIYHAGYVVTDFYAAEIIPDETLSGYGETEVPVGGVIVR